MLRESGDMGFGLGLGLWGFQLRIGLGFWFDWVRIWARFLNLGIRGLPRLFDLIWVGFVME